MPSPLARLQQSLDPRARIGRGLRSLLSGTDDGPPEWIQALAEGTDEGYFGPDSAVWKVHGDLATLVGGVRALLMQTLHPAAVTGVDQHSTYHEDPLGRLAGTTRWLTVTTFADTAGADREAARVRGMHRRVVGTYETAHGTNESYRASDPRLLAWVHVAFTDSFLTTYDAFGAGRAAARRAIGDDYVREWARSAELIGLPQAPRSRAELDAELAGFASELAYTDTTARTLDFLRRPPLPGPAATGYQVLFAAAAASLRPEHRELLRLDYPGRTAPYAATRTLLGGLRLALRSGPPAAAAARTRLDHLDRPGPAPRTVRPGTRPRPEPSGSPGRG